MTEGSWGVPTVNGFAARCAVVALQMRNIAITPLLQRAGLSESDFGDRQHRISATAQAKLLEFGAETLDDAVFGLHLAERADPRDVGILFYVASGGQDLREALRNLARYFRIVNEAVRLDLMKTPQGVAVEVIFVLAFHGIGSGKMQNLGLPSL